MDIQSLVESLHPLERKVFPLLAKLETVDELVAATKLQEVEVVRALQWLQNKGMIKLTSTSSDVASLDELGKKYLKQGLPENVFLKTLLKLGGTAGLKKISEESGLDRDEVTISLGFLRSRSLIKIRKEKNELIVESSEGAKAFLNRVSLESSLLERLGSGEINVLDTSPEEKYALDELKKRKKIIRMRRAKMLDIALTDLGKKATSVKITANVVDRLTTEMISTGSWKNKNFRKYDVEINVPKIFAAKKQVYRAFLDDVRKKFTSLGFKEMTGPIVETDFWDMDALFMPQFHSARDIHDAYYVKEPKYGKLDEKLVQRVKQAHENGFGTGSRGWRYEFDVKMTHRQLLRTQGTACSARMLASKDIEIPGKYFGITRCFRSDVIDATHNVDFNQTEGIVIEENLNLRHLIGLLKMLASEFAETGEIKVVPGYFPFTEPSCSLFAKHKQLGWIELGGAGIFRPELVKPLLGKNIPVLAWGLGIDRIAMFKLGLTDIRQLFSHDIEFLRSARI